MIYTISIYKKSGNTIIISDGVKSTIFKSLQKLNTNHSIYFKIENNFNEIIIKTSSNIGLSVYNHLILPPSDLFFLFEL